MSDEKNIRCRLISGYNSPGSSLDFAYENGIKYAYCFEIYGPPEVRNETNDS
jgi:hypothetical protein